MTITFQTVSQNAEEVIKHSSLTYLELQTKLKPFVKIPIFHLALRKKYIVKSFKTQMKLLCTLYINQLVENRGGRRAI